MVQLKDAVDIPASDVVDGVNVATIHGGRLHHQEGWFLPRQQDVLAWLPPAHRGKEWRKRVTGKATCLFMVGGAIPYVQGLRPHHCFHKSFRTILDDGNLPAVGKVQSNVHLFFRLVWAARFALPVTNQYRRSFPIGQP